MVDAALCVLIQGCSAVCSRSQVQGTPRLSLCGSTACFGFPRSGLLSRANWVAPKKQIASLLIAQVMQAPRLGHQIHPTFSSCQKTYCCASFENCLFTTSSELSWSAVLGGTHCYRLRCKVGCTLPASTYQLCSPSSGQPIRPARHGLAVPVEPLQAPILLG